MNVLDRLRSAVLTGGTDLTDGQLLERFVSDRDEAAIAALVKRHGPMVWGVCQRILRNPHDAEDAFQATFLVLLRKAASIVPREMVGNWVYGVTHLTALKARAMRAKRQTREKRVADLPEPATAEADTWRELEPLLDQELSRLPDKYRVAIVLCDLEGKRRKDVARQLNIPEGTLSSRLTTARAMLAKRLARHGLAVSGAAFAMMLSQKATAGVPTAVMTATISGLAGHARFAVKITGLADCVLKRMFLAKLKLGMALLLVIGVLTFAGTKLAWGVGEPVTQPPAKADPPPKKPAGKTIVRKELDKLQGTWVAVAAEKQSEKYSAEKVEDAQIRLTIAGDQFTLTVGKRPGELKGTLKIDPSKEPRTMDWLATRPEDGKSLDANGIYRLEGDTLTFCYGKDRPTEFKTRAERELDERLYVFKKERR